MQRTYGPPYTRACVSTEGHERTVFIHPGIS